MVERIIGNYSSDRKGPLLFITAGVHGNEPSGVQALQNIFQELQKTKPEIKGRVVGVVGNAAALEKEQRFLDEDLNRTWTEDNVSKETPESREQLEMHEIISVLEDYPPGDYPFRYFLDCHTTSSDSLPYISVQDVNQNDEWAQKFPGYKVRGFSDIIYGAIDHYMSRTGLTGFVFEAGQHTNPAAIENHEGIIWLAIKEACELDLEQISCFPPCVENFSKKNAPSNKTFEIIHRHEIKEGDIFKMLPGYTNFQQISKGDVLAMNNGKEIRSDWDAYIFMPLYQSQGNDGFFVIRSVK